MIREIRKIYNREFTPEKYQIFLRDIGSLFGHQPAFRIAETPIFVPDALKEHLFRATKLINDVIVNPSFLQQSEGSLQDAYRVPNEDGHTTFLQMDFGITRSEDGELIPQLIEVQGFPSLYFYQHIVANMYAKHFYHPPGFSHLFTESAEEYIENLRELIVGNHDPKHVVLMEVEPDRQTTQIDFLLAGQMLGIKTLCISKLKKAGGTVYYEDEDGKKIQVHRIFNRVIRDELLQRDDLPREFHMNDDVQVEWIGHPNWFFRISKYTMPFLKNQYVPNTFFLKDLDHIPDNLEDYVLKPLFSFSGSGVIFHVNRETIEQTQDPSNYILQRKVRYDPVVETPDEPVKCEVRMLMTWKKGAERPTMVNNLARLSKGEMIGVRYNRDKDWVGASVGLFPVH
ncbi:MAG: hypothetical protein OEQ53_17285 [Saprospiraceae bacterium]|nr:hypothetical protein [Saprospiraceae bacterium]